MIFAKLGRPREVAPSGTPGCTHCRTGKVNRPRGLCWGCFYAPGVRSLYPPTAIQARRGVGNLTGRRPAAVEPTAACPGTEEKIAALAERARLGLDLWHPIDGRLPDTIDPGTAE